MKKLCISVDVEGDLPGVLRSGGRRGVDEGLPRILEALRELGIRADFFFQAPIAKEHPDLVKRVAKDGNGVGNHGLDHRILCTKSSERQRRDIEESTRILERITSMPLRMFRAPNFSVDRESLQLLERAGYSIDSSVLPGRYKRRFGFFRAYDHRGSPREPYRPFVGSTSSLSGRLLEIPITENPMQPGTPVGLGALNRFGARALLDLLAMSRLNTHLFLIHPWEAVDLAGIYPDLPPGYRDACSPSLRPFRDFVLRARSMVELSSLGTVAAVEEGQ